MCRFHVTGVHPLNARFPHLSGGYEGWQAFDATPQETSEIGGLYACGPCPVAAIKQGNLHIPYDGKFIFSEVIEFRTFDRCR